MSKNEDYSDMNIVTEIGAFGSLNIEDPTIKKVKKKKENGEEDDELITNEQVSEIIDEAIRQNRDIDIKN